MGPAADMRRLCARLYTRKRTWFRQGDLAYNDIADMPAAVAGLLQYGFLQDGATGVALVMMLHEFVV